MRGSPNGMRDDGSVGTAVGIIFLRRRLTRGGCRVDAPRRAEIGMTRGDKHAYTQKQKRQAAHIEHSEREQGRSRKDAERIAWATVNKHDGGGRKSGSGRAHARHH